MEPELYYGEFISVETLQNSYVTPADMSEEIRSEDPDAIIEELGPKWAVRLSMAGCLDCTEWELFDTEEEQRARAEEREAEEKTTLSDDDEDDDEDCKELTQEEQQRFDDYFDSMTVRVLEVMDGVADEYGVAKPKDADIPELRRGLKAIAERLWEQGQQK